MISLDSFIAKYTGQTCEHPQGIDGQCVCLYRCYLDEVLEVPQSPSVKSARLLWNTYNPEYFDRIPKSIFPYMKRGDIVIFDAFPGNPHGHVGIVTKPSSSLFNFMSFDSNWSVPLKAYNEIHNHKYVLGVLRKKETLSPLDKVRKSINPNFKEIYKREPVKEDNDYYLSRIGKPAPVGIHTEAVLRNKMKYWAAQPHDKWLKERKKVLGL